MKLASSFPEAVPVGALSIFPARARIPAIFCSGTLISIDLELIEKPRNSIDWVGLRIDFS